MNPEDYVSYPLALALKKAGFDWKCDHYYCAFDNEADVRFWSIHPAQSQNGLCTPRDTVVADAPTLAQAQKWLREEWKIHVYPTLESVNEVSYDCHIVHLRKDAFRVNKRYCSYESALSAGIAAALELIEMKGE